MNFLNNSLKLFYFNRYINSIEEAFLYSTIALNWLSKWEKRV